MALGDQSMIIIAGTTKAGTGSAFQYLGDHPDICPSNIKETRFFFDTDFYSLPQKYSVADDLDKYGEFFTHCRGQSAWLEATPDYLYSPTTPERLAKHLTKPAIILILREPIARLVSWFRFSKEHRLIDPNLDFESYVSMQEMVPPGELAPEVPQHLRSLEQGCYAYYIEPFLETFDRSASLLIYRFEDFVEDPRVMLDPVCEVCDLDAGFYDSYSFQVVNKTYTMKIPLINNLYVRFRRFVRMRIHNRDRLRTAMRRVRRSFEPLYLRLLVDEHEEVKIPPDLRSKLMDYYREDISRLAALLGPEWAEWLHDDRN